MSPVRRPSRGRWAPTAAAVGVALLTGCGGFSSGTTAPAAGPRTEAVVLRAFPATASGNGTNSQVSASPAFNRQAAADFVVPAGQSWTITEVDVKGFYLGETAGPATSANVFFYADSAGLPVPPALISRPGLVPTGGPNFTLALGTPVVLGPGTYWVSVQAVLDSATAGTWFWRNASAELGLHPAAFSRNDVAPCLNTWGGRATCVGDPSFPGQSFQLLGTTTATNSPTPPAPWA